VTTFRTGRATVVNVEAPEIVIPPGLVPEDLDRPWQSGGAGREALREELLKQAAGLARKYYGNPILEHSQFSVEQPFVIKHEGVYYMFLGVFDKEAGTSYISLATSTDGVNFTPYNNYAEIIPRGSSGSWDEKRTTKPVVFYDEYTSAITGETRWGMYYAGQDAAGTWRVGLAHSSDLINWTKSQANPVLDVGGAGEWDSDWVLPMGLFYDRAPREYRLYYLGFPRRGVGVAGGTEPNALTKYDINPVFPKVQTGLDVDWDVEVEVFTVTRVGSWFIMVYDGRTHDLTWRTGLAYSLDGLTWGRVGLPLLDRQANLINGYEAWEVAHPNLFVDDRGLG